MVRLGVILVIGLAIFSWEEASGQEKYLCVPDHATGFKYNKNSKSWEQVSFTTDHKYIVSKSDDKRYAFKVTKLGDTLAMCYCEKDINKLGFLFCEGMGVRFEFNKENGRYILTYTFGYCDVLPNGLFPTDEKSDTPFIEIGKCSPF